MAITLPILGPEAFTTDPVITMSRLLAHSLEADYSQSNVYAGTVTSMQQLIAEHGHDSASLSSAVERAYKAYYERYFDEVTVQFKLDTTGDNIDEAKQTYDMAVEAFRDGKMYQIGETLMVDATKGTVNFVKVMTEGE